MSFDRTDPADLAALKTEVNTDPLGIGYDPLGGTQDLLDLLNAKNYTVSKPMISSALIRSSVTFDAYDGLLTPEQGWLQWLTSSGSVGEEDLTVTDELRQKLAGDPVGNDAIWAAADRNAMNPIMLAIIDVPGSRAEVLFGYGTFISRDNWIAARES